MDKKEQARLRKQRQRDKERDQKSKDVTLTPSIILNSVTQDVTHPIMKWLTDRGRREKLEAIVKSVKAHNQSHNLYLGAGKYSLPLDVIGEMLECTH